MQFFFFKIELPTWTRLLSKPQTMEDMELYIDDLEACKARGDWDEYRRIVDKCDLESIDNDYWIELFSEENNRTEIEFWLNYPRFKITLELAMMLPADVDDLFYGLACCSFTEISNDRLTYDILKHYATGDSDDPAWEELTLKRIAYLEWKNKWAVS